MIAIILNSGIGKRLGNLTKENPKCLVEIKEQETILGHQLKHLERLGITKVIITTGPFADKLKAFVWENFPQLSVRYVHNPFYSSTNYIYSLHLARNLLQNNTEEILLLHGDLVFENEVLKNMIQSSGNRVLLDRSVPPPEKDFKGRVSANGTIQEIGVKVFGENCHFLAPLYKLSSESFQLWLNEMGKAVTEGKTTIYAEEVFTKIAEAMQLAPHYFDGKFCMEIDNPEDLEKVRENWNHIKN